MAIDAQEAAKRLFGRRLRVELASWITAHGSGRFYLLEAQQAMERFGHAASSTRSELGVFVHCEMLRELNVGKRRYFERQASPLWLAFKAIDSALGTLPVKVTGTSGAGPVPGRQPG